MHDGRSETTTTQSRLASLPGEADRVAGCVTPAETPGSGTSRVVTHSSRPNLNLFGSRARRVRMTSYVARLTGGVIWPSLATPPEAQGVLA
jgi:hypothetical protein